MVEPAGEESPRPKRYVLEEYRQRNIAKFGVKGQEYKLSIDLVDRSRRGYETAHTYSHMLETLHAVLQGEF